VQPSNEESGACLAAQIAARIAGSIVDQRASGRIHCQGGREGDGVTRPLCDVDGYIHILTEFLGLSKLLSTAGIIGILAVVISCLLISLQSLCQVRLSSYLTLCCLLAVVAAVGTTGYTLVDNQALF
jgi:hypothetical protein